MIDIDHITFHYQQGRPVLSDFSLTFGEGGVYGLLGRNGTGKSTLLYLITGLLRPQGGQVRVDGIPSWERRPEQLRELFLVPEEYSLPPIRLSKYVGALMPFYPHFDRGLLEQCLHEFGMPADMDMGSLSMGQKKKVYMCIALAAGTRYLLLDEPTNGLDILSKSQFRKVMLTRKEEGKTVVISTHQVHDVEPLLDRVVIIDSNRVLLERLYAPGSEGEDLEQLFVDTLTRGGIS